MYSFNGKYIINYNKLYNEYTFVKLLSNSHSLYLTINYSCKIRFKIKYDGCKNILFKYDDSEHILLNENDYSFDINNIKNQITFTPIDQIKKNLVIIITSFYLDNNDNNYNLLENYNIMSDLIEYLAYSNKITPYKQNLKFIKTKTNENYFDTDHYFYKYVNNIDLFNGRENYGKNYLLKHIIDIGFEKGLIYHPKQIYNLFNNTYNNITILSDINNNIFIKKKSIINDTSEIEDIRLFVKREIYDKDYDHFISNFIIKHENNLIDNELFILVFIGNKDVGIDLINKIINYKKIQNFGLAICFKTVDLYNLLKNIVIENFTNYAFYSAYECGTDITPTLMMYNDLTKKVNFNKIIKLQTKSEKIWFDEVTDYILSKNLSELDRLFFIEKNNCNCLGHPNKRININDKFEIYNNSKLKNKYKLFTDKNYFIAGTIFYCEKILFDKLLDFIKNNDHITYFTNNLYDTNIINISNSVIHYLERLFGIIKLS